MSGHSKWSTIKHKKAPRTPSAARSSASCQGIDDLGESNGGDPSSNITLRTILSKCKP
jgi:transcriptional/translational regulatory protein YebC/TACO1